MGRIASGKERVDLIERIRGMEPYMSIGGLASTIKKKDIMSQKNKNCWGRK